MSYGYNYLTKTGAMGNYLIAPYRAGRMAVIVNVSLLNGGFICVGPMPVAYLRMSNTGNRQQIILKRCDLWTLIDEPIWWQNTSFAGEFRGLEIWDDIEKLPYPRNCEGFARNIRTVPLGYNGATKYIRVMSANGDRQGLFLKPYHSSTGQLSWVTQDWGTQQVGIPPLSFGFLGMTYADFGDIIRDEVWIGRVQNTVQDLQITEIY